VKREKKKIKAVVKRERERETSEGGGQAATSMCEEVIAKTEVRFQPNQLSLEQLPTLL
jgi:hypothetical protein